MPALVRRTLPLLSDVLDILGGGISLIGRSLGQDPGTLRVEDRVVGDRYVVRAELPGVDPVRDLDVTVAGDTLLILAECQEGHGDAWRPELRHGSVARTVSLPNEVDREDAVACYDNGVLEISLAMRESRRFLLDRGAGWHMRRVPVRSLG